jgi:hypothetical protein
MPALSLLTAVRAIRTAKRDVRWIKKVKFGLAGLACAWLSWCAVFCHLIGPAHRI